MKKETGRKGEDKAALYLIEQGYIIVQRNYRCRWGEVDIICRKGSQLVFVEVRVKTSSRFGEPEESITDRKIAKIRKTAFEYMTENPAVKFRSFRFDFIGITGSGDSMKLNHIEGAF